MNVSEDRYISSREAQNILGDDSGKFFYYVQTGQIEKVSGEKKRETRYKEADIFKIKEKLAKKRYKKAKPPTNSNYYIDWIKNVNDVLTSLKLDYTVYGEEVANELADLSYYHERVKRNSRVALAVYDSPKRESILAYISLLPLPEQLILDILAGKKHETDIKTDEVETYDREGAYTLLAESVVSHPEYPGLLNPLLRALLDFWIEQYPHKYISRIYAQAASHKGDILIQKLYFAPLYQLARNAFMLDLERPGASRFVRHFQNCLMDKGWKLPEE